MYCTNPKEKDKQLQLDVQHSGLTDIVDLGIFFNTLEGIGQIGGLKIPWIYVTFESAEDLADVNLPEYLGHVGVTEQMPVLQGTRTQQFLSLLRVAIQIGPHSNIITWGLGLFHTLFTEPAASFQLLQVLLGFQELLLLDYPFQPEPDLLPPYVSFSLFYGVPLQKLQLHQSLLVLL